MKLLRFAFLLLGFSLIGLSFLPKIILALTETDGDLQVTYDSPLFPPSVLWYPGLKQTKSLTVRNLGSSTHTVYLQAQNTSTTSGSDYPAVLLFTVSEGGLVRYGSGSTSLQDFWNSGTVHLSDLAGKATTNYDLQVALPSSVGNSYQGKTAGFDLLMGFVGTNNQVIVSGGGGGAGGGNPSAPVCNDAKPGSAPVLTSVLTGANSVTLFWNRAADPVTYYLVAYGVSPGADQFGNPNVGGKDTTSYTVSGLSGGTTYYFKVRGGNGCVPGDYSNILSAVPGGALVSGPAAGFAPGVLGQSTPSAIPATPAAAISGSVQGATNFGWWWLLWFFAAWFVFLIFRWRQRRES